MDYESMTNEELMCQVSQGDRQAFDVLYRRNFDNLVAGLRHLVRDRDLAEVDVQEALLHVWARRDTWAQEGLFLPWFNAIVRHCAADRHKKDRRFPQILFSNADVREEKPGPSPAAREGFVRIGRACIEAYRRLGAGEQEVIYLRFYKRSRPAPVVGGNDNPGCADPSGGYGGGQGVAGDNLQGAMSGVEDCCPAPVANTTITATDDMDQQLAGLDAKVEALLDGHYCSAKLSPVLARYIVSMYGCPDHEKPHTLEQIGEKKGLSTAKVYRIVTKYQEDVNGNAG